MLRGQCLAQTFAQPTKKTVHLTPEQHPILASPRRAHNKIRQVSIPPAQPGNNGSGSAWKPNGKTKQAGGRKEYTKSPTPELRRRQGATTPNGKRRLINEGKIMGDNTGRESQKKEGGAREKKGTEVQ